MGDQSRLHPGQHHPQEGDDPRDQPPSEGGPFLGPGVTLGPSRAPLLLDRDLDPVLLEVHLDHHRRRARDYVRQRLLHGDMHLADHAR